MGRRVNIRGPATPTSSASSNTVSTTCAMLGASSARETAMRVALASAARVILKECGVSVANRVVAIGPRATSPRCPGLPRSARADAQLCAVRTACERAMVSAIDAAKGRRHAGRSFEVYATAFVGLGSYAQWDRRLEAPLAVRAHASPSRAWR